jgi:hypothetical protein
MLVNIDCELLGIERLVGFEGRWLNADPSGFAGGINVYGYVGNNPIGRIDPMGLATASLGAQISGAYGVQGALSGQFTVSVNGWNPLKWRVGSTASITPFTGMQTGSSASAGILASYAPHLSEPEGFAGWSTFVGASAAGKVLPAGIGLEVSNLSVDRCTKKFDLAKANYNLFVGLEALKTPLGLPAEIHVGRSESWAGSISVLDLIQLIW